ncbi:unnamed protein product, partial [Oikopleura dioica]
KEYCKRIVELKEPYKEVKKLYLEEFGKPMSYSTFDNWKKNGYKILSSDFAAVNFRGVPKKESILEQFEQDVFDAIDNSKLDIEGVPGLNMECIKIQQNDKYKAVDVVQQLRFSDRYLIRILNQYLIKNTKGMTTQTTLIKKKKKSKKKKWLLLKFLNRQKNQQIKEKKRRRKKFSLNSRLSSRKNRINFLEIFVRYLSFLKFFRILLKTTN